MPSSIVVVRLGAMGDIVHSLPIATSLKRSFPNATLTWITRPVWRPLLAANPYIDDVLTLEPKREWRRVRSWQRLTCLTPDLAVDAQGLIQSAIVARATRPRDLWGLSPRYAREPLACVLYSRTAETPGPHRVERNLQLARAAGAHVLSDEAWLPPGQAEGALPDGKFVLAAPFAGWKSKQWPLDYYAELAAMLARIGIPLVCDVAARQAAALHVTPHIVVHTSSLSGLIYATRRAAAIVGVDSGPLHVAAAIRKPGVAIYGPTDPVQTGPYGASIRVLRDAHAKTTYSRENEVHPTMRRITPQQVYEALVQCW